MHAYIKIMHINFVVHSRSHIKDAILCCHSMLKTPVYSVHGVDLNKRDNIIVQCNI